MKTIDITTILGTELKSRTSARDFEIYLNNMKITEVCVDFSHVKAVTRSFMDEFYQLFIKGENNPLLNVHLQNLNLQAKSFLESVAHSSSASRRMQAFSSDSDARFINLTTMQQLDEYLASLN